MPSLEKMVQLRARPARKPPPLDAKALEKALRSRIEGEVRFDDGSRALYATDASNYRQVPIGVVLPKDREDLLAAIAVCRRHNAPIVSRGLRALLGPLGGRASWLPERVHTALLEQVRDLGDPVFGHAEDGGWPRWPRTLDYEDR